MKARVPASSANLGPGFDGLAVALGLYLEVEVTESETLTLTTSGYGSEFTDPDQHLAVSIVRGVMGHDRFALRVHSEIPLARGLGSSAALAVAAAAAAGGDALQAGFVVDGHVENAAASLFGGLVAGSEVAGSLAVTELALDERARFVVAIPDEPLTTAAARSVLPATVSLHDAAVSIGLATHLVAGLANLDQLHPEFFDDVLHQPYRGTLLPWSSSLLAVMREAGALGSCWSGAGSTMLAVVTEDTADAVRAASEAALARAGVAGQVVVLNADHHGLQLS